MVTARKYVVKRKFQGVPKRWDYEVVTHELPPLKDGEALVRTKWISVDPYLRVHNHDSPVPYDQFSFQVALVQESRNPEWPVGTRVVSHAGWQDYHILSNPEGKERGLDSVYKLPSLQGLSASLAVGAVGMPGATAYFGLLELCRPRAGETVVVTGAAGAVGSLVGQIAKIKGCRVVGFAGSDDKVQWLEKELGFDKAINYKTADLEKELRAAAPKGVDCYFDNVGGEISSIIINQMNAYGRVSVCGSISCYNRGNNADMPKAAMIQPALVAKELEVRGFMVGRWINRWDEAFADLVQWVKSGQIKIRELITEGFDKVFDAFLGVLAGENTGKAVVKV